MKKYCLMYCLSSCLLILGGCDSKEQHVDSVNTPLQETEAVAGWVDQERLVRADSEPQQWLTPGRDFKQQHYSPLDQISVENVEQLGFAWEYEVTHRGRVKHGLEATPLVIDGMMITSGPWGTVYAIDAETGREIWRHDPEVDGNYARRVCCGVVNRGAAVWRGKVYVGTLDGHLLALNAKTGTLLWKVDTFVDRSVYYTITSAPWIAGDKVIIGNSGAEMGVRGYISAYDVETGEFAWRFYTVPGNPAKGYEHPELKMAAATWSPDSDWAAGGGGTVWGHMAYDPDLNLLYVGTGNGSPWPIWHRSPGGGDNLFLSTILAINPDTGRLVWHYQTTPGDSWDHTATQHMILSELEINGITRKVLMQAPKNGFFYVLDRETGELLSAKKYAEVNWASHVDRESGKPVVTEQAIYQHEPKVISPPPTGAHNWQPMSFNPGMGWVYIPMRNAQALYVNDDSYHFNPKGWSTGAEELYPPLPEIYSKYESEFTEGEVKLVAWDPVSQQAVWSVQPEGYGYGGILSTAGDLVFQGSWGGYFTAYNARTGKQLHAINVGAAIMAAPMSYAINGQQYVVVMAGGYSQSHQHMGRIIAFKLGGGDVPLPPPKIGKSIPQPPPLHGSAEQQDRGRKLYEQYCGKCHRAGTNYYPDLMSMSEATHQLFNRIVLEGLYSTGGMASFVDTLSEEDVESIHAYVIAEQDKLKQVSEGKISPQSTSSD